MQVARDITDHHLRVALEPLIRAEGFRCVELQFQLSRHTRLLRVIVYRESGMDAAALERLTRGIQFNLAFIEDPGGADLSNLSLEVSSPGIERTLRASHEYAIFAGKAVRVLRDDSPTWEHAVIEHAAGDTVTLRFGGEETTIPMATIRRAQLTGAERGGP
jgi:ribosome maturation factor RimP